MESIQLDWLRLILDKHLLQQALLIPLHAGELGLERAVNTRCGLSDLV